MATLSESQSEKTSTRHVVNVVNVPKDQPIAIPEGMSLQAVDKVIHAKMEYDDKVVAIDAEIDSPFIFESLAALHAELTERYGWASVVDTPGFFGATPPTMISVPLGPDKSVQVPFGRFTVPNIQKGHLETAVVPRGHKEGEALVLHITGQVTRRDEGIVNDIVAGVRERVRSKSIYKGTAFTVRLRDAVGRPLPMPEPKFKRLDPSVRKTLVLSKDTQLSVDANIFALLRWPEAVRRINGTLKRGILLAGKFGGGKTMIANATAQEAIEHGWTYIEVEHIGELTEVLRLARYYQPAVVFCEDLDRLMRGEERTVTIDEVLNTVDGVDSKGVDIMVVFTTNELDNISPAMLRPGRLDAIIPIEAPDAEAAARLVRQYGGDLVNKNDEFTESRELLAGRMPSVIREAVDRSKLYALHLNEGVVEGLNVTDEALAGSVRQMEAHISLLTPREPDMRSETVKAADTLAEAVVEAAKLGVAVPPIFPIRPAHSTVDLDNVDDGEYAHIDAYAADIPNSPYAKGNPKSRSRRSAPAN